MRAWHSRPPRVDAPARSASGFVSDEPRVDDDYDPTRRVARRPDRRARAADGVRTSHSGPPSSPLPSRWRPLSLPPRTSSSRVRAGSSDRPSRHPSRRSCRHHADDPPLHPITGTRCCSEHGRPDVLLSREAATRLSRVSWPGWRCSATRDIWGPSRLQPCDAGASGDLADAPALVAAVTDLQVGERV